MGFEIKHEILAYVIFSYNTYKSSWQMRSSWVTGSFDYGSSKASSFRQVHK